MKKEKPTLIVVVKYSIIPVGVADKHDSGNFYGHTDLGVIGLPKLFLKAHWALIKMQWEIIIVRLRKLLTLK